LAPFVRFPGVPIDSIDNHLSEAREIDRAAMPLGMYLAWCVNLGLVSDDVARDHERLVLRVRMHDALGSELLIALGGELTDAHLNERGRDFTAGYYAEFMDDFRQLFGERCYEAGDTWDNYSKLAAVLTPKLLGPSRKRDAAAGFLGGLKKRWRAVWH
jgi:hypothetical protein